VLDPTKQEERLSWLTRSKKRGLGLRGVFELKREKRMSTGSPDLSYVSFPSANLASKPAKPRIGERPRWVARGGVLPPFQNWGFTFLKASREIQIKAAKEKKKSFE